MPAEREATTRGELRVGDMGNLGVDVTV